LFVYLGVSRVDYVYWADISRTSDHLLA
jgi:hypothetical protein